MNAPLNIRMDKATFLRWAETQEGKYELIGGRPVLQQTPVRRHGYVARAIEEALKARIDLSKWMIWHGDITVEIGDELRVPDVLVEPAGLDEQSQTTSSPILIVEVLSPSSRAADFKEKPAVYFQLSSLKAYIVASQQEMCLWVWQRSRDASCKFPDEPVMLDRAGQSIDLECFGISIPITEIYPKQPAPAA